MRKVYFKVSGNKAMTYQLNSNCFLTSENRLKSSIDSGKSYNNDTSTYITMPVSFYKENFKYCRSTGIYIETTCNGKIFYNLCKWNNSPLMGM